MESYRNSSIILPKEIIDKKFKDHITIHKEDCTQINCFEPDNTETPKDCERIFGNSFGPFLPESYFNQKIRIVALLKEDYIVKDSFFSESDPDRGHHDKASEYNEWEKIQSNDTYSSLAKLIGSIVQAMDSTKWKETCFLKNTAIINVNPFPGLAIKGIFNSADIDREPYLLEWANLSYEKIKEQIDLFEPKIVFAGGVMKCFLPNNYFTNIRNGITVPNATIFGRTIENAYVIKANDDVGIYIDKKGTYWFDDNHPFYYSRKNTVDKHANSLYKLLREHFKTNIQDYGI